MNQREHFLRNASLQGHDYIPMRVTIAQDCYKEDPEAYSRIYRRYAHLFNPNEENAIRKALRNPQWGQHREWVDAWGCRWEKEEAGTNGLVTGCPLETWENMEKWEPPVPPRITDEDCRRLAVSHEAGELTSFGVEHGFFFMRCYYLRGFENYMMDVATEEPRLDELIEIIASYYESIFDGYLECGVPIDFVRAADDLGTQQTSMLGPQYFARYVAPTYARLFHPMRKNGAHVYLHADGYLMDIMDQIIESGVSIINPQDRLNGVDALAEHVKGRICMSIAVDSQHTLPYGSPQDVRELIKEEVMKLGSPLGGLELVAPVYAPTPVENVEALCKAMTDYQHYWVGK